MRSQEHLVREGRATASGDGIIVVTGPGITGTPQTGETLTRVAPVTRGSEDTTVAYQWFAGSEPIEDATGNTYVVQAEDIGKYITLRAVMSNPNFPAATRMSRPVLVLPTAPVNTVLPAITGTEEVGETLTTTNGTWTGTPTPTYTRQWRRDGDDIDGATATTYVLVAEDEGADIDVVVTATNSGGAVTATADAVGPIAA